MNPRTKARLAAGTVALGGLLCTAMPAHAALTSPQANAFVVSADAIGNLVAVPPTPTSTYPSGGTNTVVGLSVGPLATNATLTAKTTGDMSTGASSASATVENLSVNLGGLATVSLTAINSTCTATAPPAAATGSGTIASGKVTLAGLGLLPITLKANAAPNTTVAVPGIASIVLNEQSTDANGVLTVNAVHIKLLGGAAANVIIGHAQCGGAPATNTNPTPMISAPVAAGAGATAVVGGVVMLRRRNRGKGMFDAS
jgi:hypothetical protein